MPHALTTSQEATHHAGRVQSGAAKLGMDAPATGFVLVSDSQRIRGRPNRNDGMSRGGCKAMIIGARPVSTHHQPPWDLPQR